MFHIHKKTQGVFVIGCSRLGSLLADTLYAQGRCVTVLDHEEEAFRKLSFSFGGMKQRLEATDLEELKEMDFRQAEEVFVVTEDDCTNVLCALLLNTLYPSLHILVRLRDMSRQAVLEDTQIEVICPDLLCLQQCSSLITNHDRQTGFQRKERFFPGFRA